MSIWRQFFSLNRKTTHKQNDCPAPLRFKRLQNSCKSKEIKAKGCDVLFRKPTRDPLKIKINTHTHTHTHTPQCKDRNFAPVNGTSPETLFLIFNQGCKTDFKGHLSWQFYFLLEEEERWISVKPDHSQNNCSPDISKWVCKRKYSGNWSY